MDIQALIDTLNAVGEKTKIEAKTGREIGKSILETVCAFANEPNLDGGILLLGVKKIEASKHTEYQAVGVSDPEKIIDDLVSQCRTVFNYPIQIEVRAPLIMTIRRILSAIMDDLPKAFALPEGSAQRQDIPIIPTEVIREAVVNAVMHRNYRVHQPVQIIRYANRIEIRNPGYSLIPEEQLGQPGSKSRNTKIASTLHETHFAETKGSGIRIMRESMNKAGLSPPFFESDRSCDLFTATFLFHHFLGEEDLEWLAHFRDLHLPDDQARALIFTKEVGAINNAAYRSMTQTDTLTASIALRNLRDLGLLETKSQGPGTYYIPTENLLMPRGKTHQSGDKTHQLEDKTHQLEGETHRASSPLPPDEEQVNLASLPPPIRDLLENLRKKSPKSAVRAVILALCQHQEMTPNQLALLMSREKKHLVRTHLSPMVKV